jgi:hypothetical protein
MRRYKRSRYSLPEPRIETTTALVNSRQPIWRLLTHPHFVRVSALRAMTGFFNPKQVPFGNSQRVRKIRFALYGEAHPEIVRVTASDTSDQRNHCRGRDRQCGEPLSSSAYLRRVSTRPIRRSRHPRRSKAFPSPVGLCLVTVPALVVHCQERIRPGGPDAPTGVSVHRDFRSASHLGGYGTLLTSRRY